MYLVLLFKFRRHLWKGSISQCTGGGYKVVVGDGWGGGLLHKAFGELCLTRPEQKVDTYFRILH